MIVSGGGKSPIPWMAVAMAAILTLYLVWSLARPIGDADVFWHMAYAKQMIARRTLRPDHTLYSWMPASNRTIYCSWLSEFLLLGLWNCWRIGGLEVLRYAGVFLTVALMAWFAWRARVVDRPLTWLLILFATMRGIGAAQPKPEIFSLVMWHALLYCYFRFRLAVRLGTDPSAWLYAVPVLMILWVNLHGGFILAAPFLAVTLIGEWVRPTAPGIRRKMTIAWSGALLATAATPYGIRYPLQLFEDYALHSTARPDENWNTAHQSAFSDAGFSIHLPEYLAVMALAGVVWLVVRRGRVDWLILILNLIYVPLYCLYLRSTFLLPVLFVYSAIFLAGEKRPELRMPAWAPTAAALVFLFWIGRSYRDSRVHPEAYSWTGFGYSYYLPVEEAEFVARADLGPRLYNLFDSGGYLLWRLYPQYQVMTDSRSFPYLSWFEELYHFTREASPDEFQQFLASHPARIALIDLKESLVWRNFLKTRGWFPAFYGPSAAVFEKTDRAPAIGVAGGVRNMRNPSAAFNVFNFAVAIADFRTAWSTLDQLNGPLRVGADLKRLEPDLTYREAHAALRAGDFDRSEQLFMDALKNKTVSEHDALILTLLRGLREARTMSVPADVDQIPPALRKLAAPE